MGLLDKHLGYRAPLDAIRSVGADPSNVRFDAVLSPTEGMLDGRKVILLGTNNYLGLTFDEACIEASATAVRKWGTGTTGSRFANGTFAGHLALEQDLAKFYDRKHAMVFTTGYQANLGVISGLCGPDDTIVLDIESHASIYDGAKLSGAQLFAFRHNSSADLARKLARQADGRRCLVVVEGLYSISGDVAPLPEIVAACRAAGAWLMVDEAHSFGAFGARGLGCAEAQGVLDEVDFVVGTFSKALAGVGGYCVSNHAGVKLLHFAARPYVFTASGSPANIAGVHAALEILSTDMALRARLWDNIRRARAGLERVGFATSATESPIVTIEIGTADRTIAMWRALLESGVYTNIVLPPACRPEACLLRSSFSAAHTPEQIDRALAAFEMAGRALSIIETAA
jgi:8-amino-7-oxononanoate synthase